MSKTDHAGKAVLVHAGARDAYQLAVALAERGMLEALVTDLFWSEAGRLNEPLARFAPRLHRVLLQRSVGGLLSQEVRLSPFHGLRTLRQELADHPDCASSLCQEWELALPEADFDHLLRETAMFGSFLVASTFTKNSLIEHGADPAAISVVPYGVDLERFRPDPARTAQPATTSKLRLLFVGRINQRKGIKYLLQALQQLGTERLHLTVCGRVVDSLGLFRESGVEVEIRPSVGAEELVAAYQAADLFVFPSVAEGFAQVLLEALACGLPILSTTHTAAPDLITNGVEGFILKPRRPDLLAEQIAWCLDHRAALFAMRARARATAETFTWERFRAGAAAAVASYLETLAG